MAIKAALFGTKPSYPADTDWDEVVKEAKAQTVLGIISPVIPVHDESVEQGKATYMRILYEQDKLIKLFDEYNIPSLFKCIYPFNFIFYSCYKFQKKENRKCQGAKVTFLLRHLKTKTINRG